MGQTQSWAVPVDGKGDEKSLSFSFEFRESDSKFNHFFNEHNAHSIVVHRQPPGGVGTFSKLVRKFFDEDMLIHSVYSRQYDVVVEDASFIWPSRGAVSFDELWADEVPIVHGEVRLGLKLKGRPSSPLPSPPVDGEPRVAGVAF